jgi:hypothetical protein
MPNRHGRKSIAPKAIYQGLGSIDQSAAARSELGAVFEDNQRAMVHVSTNFGPQGDAHGYEIVRPNGAFHWLESTTLTTATMLQAELTSEDRSKIESAVDFLKQTLNDSRSKDDQLELPKGYKLAKNVVSEARKIGISERTLERAKERLRVKSEPHDHEWYWKLPGCFWPPHDH